MNNNTPYKIGYYSKVKTKHVEWLWYPYIPFGKITIIQGDPGEGKSTFAINLISMITNGAAIPFTGKTIEPSAVVYQNSEDGKEDTIVPRMKACGTNLDMVAYIDETDTSLDMGDTRLERAIEETNARLIILDPIQSYLGDTDMNRAADIRPLFNKLSAIAQRKNCAVILIGHMSKSGTSKGLYRGLGSIDIAAVARSVLLISKIEDDLRILAPIKNNLAPIGDSILFQIYEGSKIKWIKTCKTTAEQVMLGDISDIEGSSNKILHAMNIISFCIKNGNKKAVDINNECANQGISKRTIDCAKAKLGIVSTKTKDGWIWDLAHVEATENG